MHHKKRIPKTYIHYGSATFDPKHKLSPERWDKPAGFWASPISCGISWKDFCKGERWNLESLTVSFRFHLKKGTRILKVHDMSDIRPYLDYNKPIVDWFKGKEYAFDHEALRRDYDGMELFLSDSWYLRDYIRFYTWDVDSLVLWNLDKVIVEK